jgi:hypothetical protein
MVAFSARYPIAVIGLKAMGTLRQKKCIRQSDKS